MKWNNTEIALMHLNYILHYFNAQFFFITFHPTAEREDPQASCVTGLLLRRSWAAARIAIASAAPTIIRNGKSNPSTLHTPTDTSTETFQSSTSWVPIQT